MLRSRLSLCALGLLIVLAAGTGIGMLVYKVHALNAQSKAFVGNAVPAIAASWNEEQLLSRATPELRDQIMSEDLPTLSALSTHLGQFAEYLGATGEVSWVSLAGFGGSISATYVAKASFVNGITTFRLTLVRLDGRWMISEFHLDAVQLDPAGSGLLQSDLFISHR